MFKWKKKFFVLLILALVFTFTACTYEEKKEVNRFLNDGYEIKKIVIVEENDSIDTNEIIIEDLEQIEEIKELFKDANIRVLSKVYLKNLGTFGINVNDEFLFQIDPEAYWGDDYYYSYVSLNSTGEHYPIKTKIDLKSGVMEILNK